MFSWGIRSHACSTRSNYSPAWILWNIQSGLLNIGAQSLNCVWLYETPWTVQPTRLLCPWDFPDKNTGNGCHFLVQEVFLPHPWNPCLWHLLLWQADSLPLAPPGKSRGYIKKKRRRKERKKNLQKPMIGVKANEWVNANHHGQHFEWNMLKKSK